MASQLTSVANQVWRNYNTANALPRLNGVSRQSSGLAGVRPNNTPSFGQKAGMFLSNIGSKVGNAIGQGLSAASDFLGGPMGLISTAVDLFAGNYQAAQSQFDSTGFNDSMNAMQGQFMQNAGNASTTDDLLNLDTSVLDQSDYINNQGYQWDGNILHGIGAIIGNARTERAKEEARKKNQLAQENAVRGILNAGEKVSNTTYRQGMANYLNNAAFGGPLFTHGSDFTDDLIRIDAGGTHEQNPIGGVPAGIDFQGIPNLVEEGEIIWDKDDYVFSDRLKMPKSLMNKYKLGGKKGKSITFAEGVDKMSEKLQTELRPNDPITKRTKDAVLTEFEDAQEDKRMEMKKREIMKAISQMSPEELTALVQPQEQVSVAPMEPPQGMENEEQMIKPVGMAAFGGPIILDGKHGTSRKITIDLAGPYRLPGVGVFGYPDKFNKEVEIHKDEKGRWWVEGRMVGKNEGDAQRYARQIANARLNLNAQEEFTEPASTEASYLEGMLNKNAREAQEQANAVLNADTSAQQAANWRGISEILRGNEQYRNFGSPGITHNPFNYGTNAMTSAINNYLNRGNYTDYTSPGIYADKYRTPDPTLLGEVIVEGHKNTTKSSAKSQGQGSGKGTPATKSLALPKYFAATQNPVEAFKQNSIMFNPIIPRTMVQKAAEGLKDTDVENTTSAGAKENKPYKTWMRYAPIVGSALSVLSDTLSQPDYSPYERLLSSSRRLSNPVSIGVRTIGNRIKRNPFDERLAVNQANQNLAAGLRGTMDTAGGNRAYRQFANNLMAYNNQAQLADIARNAYLANRQDALQTADFNRQTDMFNAQAINQKNLSEAQLNANKEYYGHYAQQQALNALENARRYDDSLAAADWTGLFTNLGNLGRENANFNIMESLKREGLDRLGYDGRKGTLKFNPDNSVTIRACGGKKKTKKRRF